MSQVIRYKSINYTDYQLIRDVRTVVFKFLVTLLFFGFLAIPQLLSKNTHYRIFSKQQENVRNVSYYNGKLVHTVCDSLIAKITSLSADTQCLSGNLFKIKNESHDTAGMNMGFSWYVNNHLISNDTNFQYSFNFGGTFEIKLVVQNDSGCLDSAIHDVNVESIKPVIGKLSQNSQCLPGNDFKYTDSTSTLIAYSRQWKLNNTTVSNNLQFNKQFNSSQDSLLLELILTTNKGCIYDTSIFLNVYSSPNIFTKTISGTVFCDHTNTLDSQNFFIAQIDSVHLGSTLFGAVISDKYWLINGIDTVRNVQRLTYLPNSPGLHEVKFTAISSYGCKADTSFSLRYLNKPTVQFGFKDTSLCLNGNRFEIIDSSKADPFDSIAAIRYHVNSVTHVDTFFWQVGQSSLKFSVYDTGTFKVTSYVETLNGCIDSFHSNVDVHETPHAVISADIFGKCQGNSSSFNLKRTYYPNHQNYSTSWYSGSTQLGYDSSLIYNQNSPGTYDIKLKVTTIFGCTDSMTKSLTVQKLPNVEIIRINNDSCLNNSIQFKGNDINGQRLRSYLWKFPDGTQSTDSIITKRFSTGGTKEIQLIATVGNLNCYGGDTIKLKLYSASTARIYAPNLSSCSKNNSFLLRDSSQAIGSLTKKVIWKFSDGQDTSYLPTKLFTQVKHSYNSIGKYNVILIVINQYGCLDSTITQLTVNSTPTADFTVDNNTQCLSGNTFNFSDRSISNSMNKSLNYYWDFGDSTIASVANPSKKYVKDGQKSILMIASNAFGCSDTAFSLIQVIPQPIANFGINNPLQCVNNNQFIFTDSSKVKSGGGVIKLSWDFGDGSISSNTVVTKKYSTTGMFKTKLFAKTSFGCIDSVEKTIKLMPKPKANFTINNDTQCFVGNSFQFYNNSSIVTGGGSISYSWNFGDGNISTGASPSFSYASYGAYLVKLKTSSSYGCSDSLILPTLVTANPQVAFKFLKPQNQCNNTDTFMLSNTTLALNGKGLSYKWDFGDASYSTSTNVQKSYGAAGNYFIKLIATNLIGCIDSAIKKVQVYPDPIVDFSVNKSAQCIKDQFFNFTNNSTIGYSGGTLNYNWIYSDTLFSTNINSNKIFSSVKTYPIKLIVKTSNGCSDSLTKNIQVFASPKADFSVLNSNQCSSNNQFKFTNNSFINIGSNNYIWSFGDGLGSGLNSPVKTYTSIGNFKVKLIATSDNGCIDSISKLISVYSQPLASIYKSDSAKCLYNNQFDFSSLSTNADNSSMKYKWTFGTTGSDTGKNVQRSFSSSGTYLIKLVVTTANGCKDSIYTNVKIHPQPMPSFNVNNLNQCLSGNSFAANNLSSISGGGTLTYGWRFGNGKSDVSTNPTWSYTNSNSYTVTLYANSNNFCTDSVKKIVTVYPSPSVGFNLSDTSQCLKNNVFNLKNTSNISSGTLYYNWDFGNSVKSNGTNPSISYASEGLYKIKLMVKSAVGCTDSTMKLVRVFAQPKAQFTVNSQMQCHRGNYFQFSNGSNINVGTLNYVWNFGDSTTSTSINPKKSFAYPSNRTSKLIASSQNGCKDSMTLSLTIKPNPQAKFYVNDSIQCQKKNEFIFYNNSKISEGKLVTNWNFGDNSIQSSYIGIHNYTVSGFYKVLLTMTSNYNCTDTVSKWIKITEQPVVSFTTNQVSSCFRDNLFETNNSSVYNGTELVNYFWKFSDGTTSKLFSPKKSFTTSGQKNITLVGITTEGCADSSVKTITVFPQGKSAIQLLDTIQCLRANKFTFGNLSRIEGEKFALLSWSFGDGTIDTVLTVRPVTYEYNDTGYFRVELTTTSENLCEDKSFGFVRVVPMPDANFTQSSNSFCENDQKFEFIAGKTPSNIILKKWELEKKTIFGIDTLKFKFALPGKYKVNYILQTNYGCGDTAVSKVIVNEAPIAQILSDKIEQCLESNKFYFTNLSSGNSIPDESWIFHDGPYLDLRTGSSQEVVYEYGGKHLVELIVENDSACIDTASTFVTVNPFPNANISIPNVCQNTPSIIRANATISSGKINSYEWNLGDGRNTIDSTPIHQYVNYGKYFINLTLRSDKGCFSKFIDSTIIYPKPIARIVVLTPRASILKDTIAFMDSSDNAETYEWNFGDLQGSTSYDMYPKNRYLDTGNFKVQLVVTSSDGCVDTAYKVVRVWPDFNLLFPTAFSPNNDGINDDYNVVGHFHSIKDFSMSIFDQNGLKVFETMDINEAWNGTLMNQGIALPSANYEVIVRVRDLYNKQFSFTKKISLIR